MSELVQLRRTRSATRAPGTAAVPAGRNVYIETYGCQMNINDTELMAGVLADSGFVAVDEPASADVILLNTCAIREHAEQRVLGRIGELQRHRRTRPDLIFGVTGCMAQRLGDDLLAGGRGVDLVAGPDGYRNIGKLVEAMQLGGVARGQSLLALDEKEDYEGLTSVRRQGVMAWVTVQRGCDHRCTFCIVPYVRGPEKNRTPRSILTEVENAVGQGYTAVTLLGQTVNSYRWEDWSFTRLLRKVSRVPGVRRVGFTSPHPNDVTEELLEVIASEPTVCRQLHLPAQSGANRVLKRMVRRYTLESYLEKVELARRVVPGIALSTDLIVGFPGESDDEFEATLDLVRTVRFEEAYLYRYSLREGTPAERFPAGEFVPDDVAQHRLERLIELQRRIQADVARSEVGAIQEVHVEREARSAGDMLGRTDRNRMVAFRGTVDLVGQYVTVRLTGTTGATFTGERAA
jgi:tRNA-2-methylthio-N6-dimethylallyladenosine synthase